MGGGIKGGHYHSQHPESAFIHVPGLKVVCPSNPYDAKASCSRASRIRTRSSSSSPNACIARPRATSRGRLYGAARERAVVRPGTSVTVLAYGAMLYEALDAAAKAAEKGVEAEVIAYARSGPWTSTPSSTA